MEPRFSPVKAIAAGIAIWAVAIASIAAHEITYQGTVIAAQAAKVQVKTVDDKTKATANVWFVVDKDTKVRRGDKVMSYADAKIVAGERIVVIINHDAATKMLATDIRLAAKP